MDDRRDPFRKMLADYHDEYFRAAVLALIDADQRPIDAAKVLREIADEHERQTKMPF